MTPTTTRDRGRSGWEDIYVLFLGVWFVVLFLGIPLIAIILFLGWWLTAAITGIGADKASYEFVTQHLECASLFEAVSKPVGRLSEAVQIATATWRVGLGGPSYKSRLEF